MIIKKLLFATLTLISLIIIPSGSRSIISTNAQTDEDNDNNTTTTITNPNAVIQQQQWKTYSDKKLGISLQYPSSWEAKQKTNRLETVPDLSLSYTNELGGKNSFAVFIMPIGLNNNLPADPDVKLVQFAAKRVEDEIIKSGQTKGLDMHIIEDVKEHYPIDGEEAFSFLVAGAPTTSSYTRVGVVNDGDNIQLMQQSIVSYHKGKFFMFGFTDLSMTFDNPTHLQVRDRILKSIKFLDGTNDNNNN